eukprot:CAMPEP_0202039296 /NCGR_PEP_ID=MMETSP0962-20130828/15538_1 /ASSEMBLY_ACC=CAM_ASM_000488 /TAXON_ID=4773 /ORGANISM="Schizochytrium aggregatum, Strain ATCC28209" /LENGTH=125 /DNA_ID=CAMNT_0048603505 /DNA_START=73 /DNA_END=448 /DNA_ORIENTATION=+
MGGDEVEADQDREHEEQGKQCAAELAVVELGLVQLGQALGRGVLGVLCVARDVIDLLPLALDEDRDLRGDLLQLLGAALEVGELALAHLELLLVEVDGVAQAGLLRAVALGQRLHGALLGVPDGE